MDFVSVCLQSPKGLNLASDMMNETLPKVPFVFFKSSKSDQLLFDFRYAHINQLIIALSSIIVCLTSAATARNLLCRSSCSVGSPSGQSLPAITRFPQRQDFSSRGKDIYPSLGSLGYSDEALKMSLNQPGWHLVGANYVFTFFFQQGWSTQAFRINTAAFKHFNKGVF